MPDSDDVPEAVEDQRLRRYGPGPISVKRKIMVEAPDPSEVARRAVDEVLGPRGPGPFAPGSGLTRGGRAESMPVRHTEDGDR